MYVSQKCMEGLSPTKKPQARTDAAITITFALLSSSHQRDVTAYINCKFMQQESILQTLLLH